MDKADKIISVCELEKIYQQAEMIYGLADIFALFLGFTGEDKQLESGMECLVNEASKHRDYCHALHKKLHKATYNNKTLTLDK